MRLNLKDDGDMNIVWLSFQTLNILIEMISQHCTDEEGRLDSFGLSANAAAIKLLADLGRVEIVSSAEKRVIARWRIEPEESSDENPGPDFAEITPEECALLEKIDVTQLTQKAKAQALKLLAGKLGNEVSDD